MKTQLLITTIFACALLAGCGDNYRNHGRYSGYEQQQQRTTYEQNYSDTSRADNTFRQTQSK